jgi:hypothetical protein
MGPDNEENHCTSRENQTQTRVKQSQKNSSISLGSGNDIPTDPELSEERGGDIPDRATNLLQAPIHSLVLIKRTVQSQTVMTLCLKRRRLDVLDWAVTRWYVFITIGIYTQT